MNRIVNKIILSWVVVLLCGCVTIENNEPPKYLTNNAIVIYNHTKTNIIDSILKHVDVALKLNEVLNATTVEESDNLEVLYFPTTLIRVDSDPDVGREKIKVGNYIIRTNGVRLDEKGAIWNIDIGYVMTINHVENNQYVVKTLKGIIPDHNSINSTLNIKAERTSIEKDFPYIYTISGNGSFNYDYEGGYRHYRYYKEYNKPAKISIEFAFADNTYFKIFRNDSLDYQPQEQVHLYKGSIELKATADHLGGDSGAPIKVIYGESYQYTPFVNVEFRGVSEVVNLVYYREDEDNDDYI